MPDEPEDDFITPEWLESQGWVAEARGGGRSDYILKIRSLDADGPWLTIEYYYDSSVGFYVTAKTGSDDHYKAIGEAAFRVHSRNQLQFIVAALRARHCQPFLTVHHASSV